MTDKRREGVSFPVNNPQEVALEQREGKSSGYDKERYLLTNNRIMFLPKEAQVKLNYLDPAVGECFWITRRQEWVGSGKKRHSLIIWDVSSERPPLNEPASNGPAGDPQVAAEATGIPETHLERQLHESKQVREAAANRIRAKLNLEQQPIPGPESVALESIPVPEEAARLQQTERNGIAYVEAEPLRGQQMEDAPPRKPVTVETQAQPATPPPPAAEPPKQPPRQFWMPNLVEVCRSFTYKHNAGDYESRDFFASQKAECRPEDAEHVSELLYQFCKRQVLKAVNEWIAETRPRRTA